LLNVTAAQKAAGESTIDEKGGNGKGNTLRSAGLHLKNTESGEFGTSGCLSINKLKTFEQKNHAYFLGSPETVRIP
jgi:hypothetical protein